MKKIVKKFGNSFVIILNKEDKRIYNLKEGDIVEIEIKDPKRKQETKE